MDEITVEEFFQQVQQSICYDKSITIRIVLLIVAPRNLRENDTGENSSTCHKQ